MSRTDDILAAAAREIELRREELDRDVTLKSVSLIVYMARGGGNPEAVAFRMESVAPIAPARRSDDISQRIEDLSGRSIVDSPVRR